MTANLKKFNHYVLFALVLVATIELANTHSKNFNEDFEYSESLLS